MLTLTFPGTPKAIQSFRVSIRHGRIHKYQPADVVAWKKKISTLAKVKLPRDFTPFTEPVRIVSCRFTFPPLKSFSKTKLKQLEAGEEIFKEVKPDITDNLMKGLIDALTGIVWKDDALICHVCDLKKVFGVRPGIELKIEPIEVNS